MWKNCRKNYTMSKSNQIQNKTKKPERRKNKEKSEERDRHM